MKEWYPYADLILKNAKIYTVDLTIPEIQAGNYDFTVIDNGYIAVKDGRIIGVGSGFEKKFSGEKTQIIDVKGKTVIPGLLDSHMHAMDAGIALRDVPCEKCTNLGEMLSLIKDRAEKEPDGTWFKASAFNELSWNDGARPDCRTLDSVTGNHPVIAARLCGHVIVANSKAMEIAGITKDTPDPKGGTIGRFEDGTPNGWFYEPAAMELIEKCYPAMTEKDYVDAIEAIGKYMNSVGLTSVIDCNLSFGETRAYSKAKQEGKLSYRSNLSFYMDKAIGDVPYHINRLREMMAVTGFGDNMLKFNGVKILLDGIPASGTAYMRKNYLHMPETRGFTTITEEELREICRAAAELNWQMAVHAIGDAAMDVTLDAFRAGGEKKDNSVYRNYIIHAVFPRDDMLPRLRENKVSVTLQPAIMGTMGEEAVLDETDKERNQPAGWYFDHGIVCGGSSDFPVVDCNPFLGMGKAMNRVCLDGKVHGAQYRISAKQALIMWTMNSAYLSFDEKELGSIEPGKTADLVVIDTPILEVSPEEVMKTKVLKTFLGGRLVYDSEVQEA